MMTFGTVVQVSGLAGGLFARQSYRAAHGDSFGVILSHSGHEVWSVHLYCPPTARYYVVYWHVSFGDEFPDFEDRFMSIARTLACHPQPL